MSNGRTRGIEGLVDGRRVFRWKRVEEAIREKIGAWRRFDHWLMPGFLPAHLVVGSLARDGAVVENVCRKIFPAGRRF